MLVAGTVMSARDMVVFARDMTVFPPDMIVFARDMTMFVADMVVKEGGTAVAIRMRGVPGGNHAPIRPASSRIEPRLGTIESFLATRQRRSLECSSGFGQWHPVPG